MPLVDLAYTSKERKEEAAEAKSMEPPEYPWGLQIRLENEELKKLGIKDLPEVGEEYHLEVVAKVTSVSENQYGDGRTERCVCLQICMAGVQLDESAADEKREGKETPASEAREVRGGVLGKKY